MVLRATHAGCVFFQFAPTRQGLAGIKQFGSCFAHRCDIAARGGGNARQVLKRIKGCTFSRQDAARIAFDHGQNVFGRNRITIFAALFDLRIRDQLAKTFKGNIKPGHNDILARFKRDAQARIGGDDIVRCDVAGADILGKGTINEFRDFGFCQDGHDGGLL